MDNLFKFLLFVLLSAPFQTSAQKIYRMTELHDSYLYKGYVYKYDQLETILSTNPSALDGFHTSKAESKKSLRYGLAALATAGTGLIAMVAGATPEDMYCDLVCISSGEIIGFIALAFCTPSLSALSLLHGVNSSNSKAESILFFNSGLSSIDEPNWNLKIGTTQHGLGLVLNF